MEVKTVPKAAYKRFVDKEMNLFFKEIFGKGEGRDHYSIYSARERKLLFRAVEDGKTVGAVSLSIGKGVARIGAFIVAKGSRGEGAGSMLLDKCEAAARMNKCKKIWLWTFHSIPAFGFYKRHGYVEEARLKKHWGGKKPLSVMSKYL